MNKPETLSETTTYSMSKVGNIDKVFELHRGHCQFTGARGILGAVFVSLLMVLYQAPVGWVIGSPAVTDSYLATSPYLSMKMS